MKTKYIKELGLELPRVTEILKIIAKGEHFNNWLKKQGDNADKLLSTAGDFGTSIHNLLEKLGKGEKTGDLTPKQQRCIDAFLSWKDENIDYFIYTERPVWSKTYGYCGTLDALVMLKDKRVALLDYKTSGQIYDTHFLQVGAYRHALMEMENIHIDTAYILRFEKKDEVKKDIEVKEVAELDYQFDIFVHALRLYNWKNNSAERKEKDNDIIRQC